MIEADLLAKGKVGVIPTDTLYGIVASAMNESAVGRVYALKKRAPTKPCIILISSIADLKIFGIELTEQQKSIVNTYWPGPVSIVMSCGDDVPEYLHGGTHTLAFRLPDDEKLIAFLLESGPLIAPSANPEGLPPATTTSEARQYFGDDVDFYIDGGVRAGEPSVLVMLGADGSVEVLRGAM